MLLTSQAGHCVDASQRMVTRWGIVGQIVRLLSCCDQRDGIDRSDDAADRRPATGWRGGCVVVEVLL